MTFLKFLKVANTTNTYISFRAKIRLIEIFTSTNTYIDSSGHFKKDKLSLQMKILEEYKQFKRLVSEREKNFVRGIVKKVFLGEEKYTYKNLT